MNDVKKAALRAERASIANSLALHTGPTYRPLVTACADHGISRAVAFELARKGLLDTFTIGTRRYVRLESLRTLPDRLAANDAALGAE